MHLSSTHISSGILINNVWSMMNSLGKFDEHVCCCSQRYVHWLALGYNSLAPGGFKQNVREVIFKLISVTDGWGIFCKIALRWMSVDLTDDKSTLVQVMARWRQATSHYLGQCWPRSMSLYGVTRPQWVLTHRGRVTHICFSHLTIIDSDNGLSPSRRQIIIWANAGILSTGGGMNTNNYNKYQ